MKHAKVEKKTLYPINNARFKCFPCGCYCKNEMLLVMCIYIVGTASLEGGMSFG